MQTILPVTRILVLLAVLPASGCGLKGDLYLPEPARQPEQAAPAKQDTVEEETDQNDGDDHDRGVAHEK